jgi:DNA-binding response OmpR family regulator
MEKPRILLVEDATELANVIHRALKDEEFDSAIAPNGETAIRLLNEPWNLIILDLMLPDFSGENVLKYVAQRSSRPPVLVLTARNLLEDKLSLFRLGCDDYLTKPFDVEELLERVRALLRRSVRVNTIEYVYDDIKLDTTNFVLSTRANSVNLTPKEAALCQALLKSPGEVISRQELLQSVWGMNREPNTNFLGVHLLNLRKKFSQLGRGEWLQTIRSSGFVIRRPETVS